MAQWQVSLVDGLMDFSFSILIALFYASVLSARYGKTKFRVIVSAVMIIATIITKHNTYASNAYVLYRDSYTYDLYIHTQR